MSKLSETQNLQSKKPRCRWFSAGLAIVSSALLLASLKLPLWQMRLEAPQYRDQEALHIAVHPNTMKGDLKEISVLNQYIGVHVPPTLPQFQWLPAVLAGGAIAGLAIGFLPVVIRRRGFVVLSSALVIAMATAAIQATTQIRDIGHKRDQKTILAGVKDFTPPFLGTSKIAQFTVSSRFGTGAWLAGAAIILQLGAGWMSRRELKSTGPVSREQTPRIPTNAPSLPRPKKEHRPALRSAFDGGSGERKGTVLQPTVNENAYAMDCAIQI